MLLGSKEAMLEEPTEMESNETLYVFDGRVLDPAETEPENSMVRVADAGGIG